MPDEYFGGHMSGWRQGPMRGDKRSWRRTGFVPRGQRGKAGQVYLEETRYWNESQREVVVEFNPVEVSAVDWGAVRRWLRGGCVELESMWVDRVDVAWDVVGVPRAAFRVVPGRTKPRIHPGPNGLAETETITAGKRSGYPGFTVYCKASERRDNAGEDVGVDWVRAEARVWNPRHASGERVRLGALESMPFPLDDVPYRLRRLEWSPGRLRDPVFQSFASILLSPYGGPDLARAFLRELFGRESHQARAIADNAASLFVDCHPELAASFKRDWPEAVRLCRAFLSGESSSYDLPPVPSSSSSSSSSGGAA
jgi:hypothetical protein